jgi:2-methylcitrate dehydratase
MVAVALLDGEVTPAQYAPERIVSEDVQRLLRKVSVRPDKAMSERFPKEMPCRIQVFLKGGQVLRVEKEDYEGFYTRPMSWEKAAAKFEQLAAPFTDEQLRHAMVEAVAHLDSIEVRQLTELLANAGKRE